MTAKGKITAANIQVGDRIIVKVYRREVEADRDVLDFLKLDYGVGPSNTKTGEGVQVARVLSKSYMIVSGGRRRDRRVYFVETSVGTFECAPIQTMILAPEDAAGIKRAHLEALVEAKLAEEVEEALAATPAETTLDASSELAQTLVTADHEEALVEYAARESIDQTAAWLTRHDCDRATFENVQALIVKDHEEALTLHSQAGKVDSMNNDAPAPPITPSDHANTLVKSVTTALAEDHTGSTVVRLLEKVWARIRADHPELPEVVIITGSGLVGASKWGHFRAEGWKVREEGAAVRRHELFLAGEALAKGARQVLQTMLHEGAHTLARVRSQQDTSRQGRWHNATFRKLAEEMGLEHKAAQADKTNGFSFVTLTASTAEKYADLLGELDREIRLVCHLPVWLGGEAGQDEAEGGEKITGKPKSGGETKSGPLKATCQCSEPLIIRLSQKVLDMGVVRCDGCESLFRAA